VSEDEAIGINTVADYLIVKQRMKYRLIESFIKKGVVFLDPDSTHLSWDTAIGCGSIVSQGVSIGRGVQLGTENKVLPYSFLEEVKSGHNCTIGPFAYIHNAHLENQVHLGAFCEVKGSHIDSLTKSKHFSYIGDATIGKKVNIAAGTVFCNYDGKNKNHCTVEDEAFLGANCSYIAPVIVGKGAFIGAGTVVRQNVESGALYVANPNHIEYKK
jgi:bifunctional UDP-N-acetylglucosamine pyrophosphorylase/glucosamine-1-phosphate N-acetyltransferase